MRDRIIRGKQLRLLREQAGLLQRELAELIGCSAGHLKNVENENGANDTRPGDQLSGRLVYRAARELSKVLGREVSVDEFTVDAAGQGGRPDRARQAEPAPVGATA